MASIEGQEPSYTQALFQADAATDTFNAVEALDAVKGTLSQIQSHTMLGLFFEQEIQQKMQISLLAITEATGDSLGSRRARLSILVSGATIFAKLGIEIVPAILFARKACKIVED